MTTTHLFRSVALAALVAAGSLGAASTSSVAATEEQPAPAPQKPASAADLRREEIELRNAVKANPNDPAAHINLAKHYLGAGNFPAAEAEAREARRLGGAADETAPLLAEALIDQNKLAQLIEQVKPADREPSAESTVRLSLGLAHLGLRELPEAEPLLRAAVRLDPESWRAKIGLARFLLLTADKAGAAEQVSGARALAPDNLEVLRLNGEILRSKGDVEAAIVEFGKIIAARPDDLAALISRANAYLGENKLAEAQQDDAAALKLAPKSGAAIYLRALILARQGKLAEADGLLQSISNMFDGMPNGYYLEGAIKYSLGQYEQADANLTKFMARQPDQAGARRLRAQIALRRNDPAKAIDLLKPVLDKDPTDQASAPILARAYVAQGKNDQAVELYEHAAEAQPDNIRAQTAAAVMRMSYGDTTEGMADLEKVTASTQGADVAAPLLVLAELRRGEVDKAASLTASLQQKNPDDPVLLNLLGSVRIAQQRMPEAEKIFRGLIDKNPQFVAARRNLAQVLIAEQRPDDAKMVLEAILEKDATDQRTLMSLAQIAIQQKDFVAAADRLQAAQKLSPKDPSAGIRLVELYGSQKDWAQAGVAMRNLVVSFPTDIRVLELAAGLRAEQGDAAGAAAEFRKLLAEYPQSAPANARYAAYQSGAGDQDGARASLAKAVSLAPHDPQYMQALVRFDFEKKGADAAVATARSFEQSDPDIAPLLVADVLTRANRTDEAIKLLNDAQRQHPSGALATKRAELVYASGKSNEAKSQLQSWIKGHDDDVGARLALASMFMREHENDDAAGLYERIRQKVPGNPVALNNLAVIYAEKGDPRAAALASEAYSIAPGPQIADTLGWVLVKGGKASEALPYLRRAGAALPQNATVQYHLAAALDATGSKAEARSLLETVMKADSAFDEKADAQKLLDRLQHG